MATDEELAALQREQELAAEPEDAASAAAHANRLDIHTSLPGIVQAFDRKALTVKVRPAIKRRWIDAGFLALPDLVDCPVQFPRFGNFIIIGPVAAGDEGWVHFAERAIDNWHARGGVQEPSEFRLHDLSDGGFAPGYWSKAEAEKVTGGAPDALEIRTLDGTTVLRVENGKVIGGQLAGAAKALNETYHKALDTYLDVIVTELGAALSALGLIPAGTTLTTAQTTFKGAAPAGIAKRMEVG